MKTKILLGAVVTAGLLIAQAPDAQADPNNSFLECLTQEGLTVTNPTEALKWASLIHQDEINRVPIGVTSRALVQKGFDPLKAGVYIACVFRSHMVEA